MSRCNFKKIDDGIYLVRTQAGFKQALKDFNNDWLDKTEVNGHPISYPSVCMLSYAYDGYFYISANCIHVNKLKNALELE